MGKTEPRYVTFEQAKWLKEKGFDILVNHYYFEDGEFRENFIKDTYGYKGDEYEVHLSEFNENWNDKWLTKKSGIRCFGCSKDRGYFETYSAPEQHQVVEWLRVNHKLHLLLDYSHDHNKYSCKVFDQFHADELRKRNPRSEGRFPYPYQSNCLRHYYNYGSPQEAYSAAFDYIKNNNLI
jgi:hypothetical protein